jgi:hypothetical protein
MLALRVIQDFVELMADEVRCELLVSLDRVSHACVSSIYGVEN